MRIPKGTANAWSIAARLPPSLIPYFRSLGPLAAFAFFAQTVGCTTSSSPTPPGAATGSTSRRNPSSGSASSSSGTTASASESGFSVGGSSLSGGQSGSSSGGQSGSSAGGSGSTGGNSVVDPEAGTAGGAHDAAPTDAGNESVGEDATAGDGQGGGAPDAGNLDDLKRAFIDLHFGLWHHFGILTYTGSWAQANLPIDDFNPGTTLNPQQWAQAAKAAGAKFGVLTTRHHDGFALWPSKASNFNVASTRWYKQVGGQATPNDRGDVVQQFVDGYRAEGLLPAFYYSIWDATEMGSSVSNLTLAEYTYVETQLTELLSNYGPIPLLILDGWGWLMGHHGASFETIHNLVKRLQPNILIVDHNGLESPYDEDLVMYEEPKGEFAPATNIWAAVQGNKVNGSGGNDWFWAPGIGNFMTVSQITNDHVKTLSARHTNFILNCPPNRQGMLDDSIVSLLQQVGQSFANSSIVASPLPAQGVQNNSPYYPMSAMATSGTAYNAIDGINDYGRHSTWQSSGSLPQSITIDLGSVRQPGFLGYLPPYSGDAPTTAGDITSYAIDVSTDGQTFTQVTSGSWPADGQLHSATFGPVAGRYVRLVATASNGGAPAATELEVGGFP